MASSDGSIQSEDWHTAGESHATSKKSSNQWETIDSDDGAAPANASARPPVAPNKRWANLPPPTPPRGDDSSSIGSHSSNIYIRADGKKVRRVKKQRGGGSISANNSVASSVTGDDETTLGSMSVSSVGSGVYIRADGKKVRRVKRSKKKKKPVVDCGIPAQVSISSPVSDAYGKPAAEDAEDSTLALDPDASFLQETTTEDAKPQSQAAGDVQDTSEAEAETSTENVKAQSRNDAKDSSEADGVREDVKTDTAKKETEKAVADSSEPLDEADIRNDVKDSPEAVAEAGAREDVEADTAVQKETAKSTADVGESLGEIDETQGNGDSTTEKPTSVTRSVGKEKDSAAPTQDPALASATQKALDGLSTNKPDTKSMNPWLVEPTDLQQEEEAKDEKKKTEMEPSDAKKVDTSIDSLDELVAKVDSAEANKDVHGSNPLAVVKTGENEVAESQQLNEFGLVPETAVESTPSLIPESAADSSQAESSYPVAGVPHGGVVLVPVEPMSASPSYRGDNPNAARNDTTSSTEMPDRYGLCAGKDAESPVDFHDAVETMGAADQCAVQTVIENATTNRSPEAGNASSPHDVEKAGSVDATLGAYHYPPPEAASPNALDDTVDSQQEGDRMVQAASREVSTPAAPPPPVCTPKRRQLPEILNERTRSRADVDAFVTPRPPTTPVDPNRGAHMVRLNDDDDAFIMRTAFAKKRVRVVQLLIFGLIGLAFGFLGSFYVQSSCHFLTATVVVGGNAEEFELHYGIWKYTPLSSAFEGYSYCYKYDSQFTSDSPIIPRIVGIVALFLGMYTLAVLWVYLVLGRTNFVHWKRAINAGVASGIFQSLTMLFFAGSVCNRNTCSIGPGAAVSIVSAITWFVLAFEMHYNTPLMLGDEHADDIHSPGGIVASLEMSDVGDGMTAFFRRITNANGHDIPTLNQYRRDKVESPHRGSGCYVPPNYGGEQV